MLLDALEKTKGSAEGKILEGWLKKKKFDAEEKVSAIRAIFDQYEIKAEAETLANDYFEKAKTALGKLPVSEDKKIVLKKFIENLEKREF